MDAMQSLLEGGVREELLTVEEQDDLDDTHQMLDSCAVDQIMLWTGSELNSSQDSAYQHMLKNSNIHCDTH